MEAGRRVLTLLLANGLDTISVLGDHLIRLFTCCGTLMEVNETFNRIREPSAHTWAAIILANFKLGQNEIALLLYDNMLVSGKNSDKYIYAGILKACTMTGTPVLGRAIHEQIISSDLHLEVAVGSTLIHMYALSGSLDEACKVFSEMLKGDIILWNVMIAGYAQHGECILALEYFEEMQHKGIKPDAITFSSILKACCSIGSIEQGRLIHEDIIRKRLKLDLALGNTLVDMYAKCGSLQEAHKMFYQLSCRNVVTWSAMVAGYAQHGEGLLALECFEKMQQEGIKPNELSFTSILIACSRAGLVNEGHWYYKSMKCHDVSPNLLHCTCMVDLLGRAGYLNEAEDLLEGILGIDAVGWKTLLNACKIHGDMGIASHCFNEIVYLDPSCIAGYCLMSDVYAYAGTGKQ